MGDSVARLKQKFKAWLMILGSAKWKTFLIKDQINWSFYEKEEKADKKPHVYNPQTATRIL